MRRRFAGASLLVLVLALALAACGGGSSDETGRRGSDASSTTKPSGSPVPAGAVTVATGATSNVSIDASPDGSTVAVAWYRADERTGEEQTLVATSRDRGRTFAKPVVVTEPATEFPDVDVLDDGTILVGSITYDLGRLLDPEDERSWPAWPVIHRSTDGGRTFAVLEDLRSVVGDRVLTGSMPTSLAASGDGRTIVFTFQDHTPPALVPAGQPALVDGTSAVPTRAIVSTDAGTTFTAPQVAADATCSCCSSTAFVAGQRPGVAMRLLERTSPTKDIRDPGINLADESGRFGAPVTIHDDHYVLPLAGCPASGPGVEEAGGVLHAAWWTDAKGRSGWWYARGPAPDQMGEPVRLPATSTITYDTVLAADGPDDAWVAGVHVGDDKGQLRSVLLWQVHDGRARRLAPHPDLDVAAQAHDLAAFDGRALLAWVHDGTIRVAPLDAA